MYSTYFGLTRRPFGLQSDPRFAYESETYLEAYRAIRDGIECGRRLQLLLGDPGTGKTTLLMKLMDEIDHPGSRVLVPYSHFSFPQILSYVLSRLEQSSGVMPGDNAEQAAVAALARLASRLEPVIVILDEAQNLTKEALLGVLELATTQEEELEPVQIVLAGAPELALRMMQSCQREPSGMRVHPVTLAPLAEQEVLQYIGHRLSLVTDSGGELFDEQALRCVAQLSEGVPRRINQVCDRALLMAYSENQRTVTNAMVERAAREALDLDLEELANISAQIRADRCESVEITKDATVAESAAGPESRSAPTSPAAQPETTVVSHRSSLVRIVDCVEPGLRDAVTEVRLLTARQVAGFRTKMAGWRSPRGAGSTHQDEGPPPISVETASAEGSRDRWLFGLPALVEDWSRGKWHPRPVHVAGAWAILSTLALGWVLFTVSDPLVEEELRVARTDLALERSTAVELRDRISRLSVELESSTTEQEILHSIMIGLQEELKVTSALARAARVREQKTVVATPVAVPVVNTAAQAQDGEQSAPPPAGSVPDSEPATAEQLPYFVKKGDTLWSIARQHGVSVHQLNAWNQLTAENSIQVGQQLRISALKDESSAGESAGIGVIDATRYKVKPGDSLYAISRQFNVSVADLQQWNRLDNGELIVTDQQLIVLK